MRNLTKPLFPANLPLQTQYFSIPRAMVPAGNGPTECAAEVGVD